MKVAFDIDGVLADNPCWARQVSDWSAFIDAIPNDGVIEEGVALVKALYQTHEVCFITGRPYSAEAATREWISRNCDLPVGFQLYMRDGSDQDPSLYKLTWCEVVRPDLVIEDDAPTAELLSAYGFKVLLFLRSTSRAGSIRCGLSARQLEVLSLVAEGYTNRQIGSKLFITGNTVKTHMCGILRAWGVKTRTRAVCIGRREGVI